jgi:hypothetical protein
MADVLERAQIVGGEIPKKGPPVTAEGEQPIVLGPGDEDWAINLTELGGIVAQRSAEDLLVVRAVRDGAEQLRCELGRKPTRMR